MTSRQLAMDEFTDLNLDYVKDRKVCATGHLVSMTHDELAKLVQHCGGTYVRFPTRSSVILVVGDGGWPSERNGSLSRVFERARKLKAYGYPIDFKTEDEFLERLGLHQTAGAIRGRHTLGDLSRILEISSVRLRRWLRAGLIQPTAIEFQIAYFDFHQVAFIKQLHELIEKGASLSDIGRGIEQAKDLLPDGHSLTSQWSNIERDGRVLLRLRDQLVDQTGQKYFDFESNRDAAPSLFASKVKDGIHDLCDQALELEEQGRLEEAACVYRRALELDPEHATLQFDLGNVLFQLGNVKESLAHFRIATEYDIDFAMAWHNLGCVYAHLTEWDDAEQSLRRALSLVPNYADSHFTLAEVMRNQGRVVEAARHHNDYLEFSKADSLLATRSELLRVVHAEDGETYSS